MLFHIGQPFYSLAIIQLHTLSLLQKTLQIRVRSHAPSIQSHRGTKVVWPDLQPMRVPEEPVCIDLFRQNPVFTSLYLKSPVHVHRLRDQFFLCINPRKERLLKDLCTVFHFALTSVSPCCNLHCTNKCRIYFQGMTIFALHSFLPILIIYKANYVQCLTGRVDRIFILAIQTNEIRKI